MSFVVGFLAVFGAAFAFVAALGIVRLPDLMTRMHAATKAGTLGAGLLLAAVMIAHGSAGVAARALAAIAFLFLTAPVASHLVGREAYRARQADLLPGTLDEWGSADGAGEAPRP